MAINEAIVIGVLVIQFLLGLSLSSLSKQHFHEKAEKIKEAKKLSKKTESIKEPQKSIISVIGASKQIGLYLDKKIYRYIVTDSYEVFEYKEAYKESKIPPDTKFVILNNSKYVYFDKVKPEELESFGISLFNREDVV